MTTHLTKIWWDLNKHKLVEQAIPEAEIYKREWVGLTDDFWDWLPKAYGDVGDEPAFTKYNMEVAYAAGAEAEAKRMWQGLTDEEIAKLADDFLAYQIEDYQVSGVFTFARAIEAKLKEKNT
jgi:hypothetical protein